MPIPTDTQCNSTLQQLAPADLVRLVLASGKSMPRDAGKFAICLDTPLTRYFLVSGKVSMMPVEFGICVPNVCDAAAVAGLFHPQNSQTTGLRDLVPFLLDDATLEDMTLSSPQLSLRSQGFGSYIAVGFILSLTFVVLLSTMLHRDIAKFVGSAGSHSRLQDVQSRHESLEAGKADSKDGSCIASNTASRADLPKQETFLPQQERQSREPWARRLTKPFALFGETGTLTKLMEIPPRRPTDCLNGLRVLSMAWIILGHTFLMASGIAGYANQEDVVASSLNRNAAETNPLFFIVLSSQSGVDSFFFLSGFLLASASLKELSDPRGRFNVLMATLLRYLRLTPSFAMVLLVYYKIWPFLGNGPFAVRFQESILQRCGNSWWSELLYLHNFVPFDSDKVCMGWTWYLGDDMWFSILGLLLAKIYYRGRCMGWFCLSLLTVSCFVITAWLIFSHHLSVYTFDDHYTEYSYWAYSKPYNRAPAYLVGIATAWLLAKLEEKGITRSSRSDSVGAMRALSIVVATCTFGLMLFLVFIPATDFGYSKNHWSDWISMLYLNFGRPLWALCWAVIMLLCYYGYLPMVDNFLSHWTWTPLVRLTYGAYLLHPLVIKLAAGRALQYYTFSTEDMCYRFCGNFVCAYGGAVVLWALVERPMMTITTTMLKSQPRGAARSCTG